MATETTSTTLDLIIDADGGQTVIDRHQFECRREFTVNNVMDLTEGAKLTGSLRAESASMKLLSQGEFLQSLIVIQHWKQGWTKFGKFFLFFFSFYFFAES